MPVHQDTCVQVSAQLLHNHLFSRLGDGFLLAAQHHSFSLPKCESKHSGQALSVVLCLLVPFMQTGPCACSLTSIHAQIFAPRYTVAVQQRRIHKDSVTPFDPGMRVPRKLHRSFGIGVRCVAPRPTCSHMWEARGRYTMAHVQSAYLQHLQLGLRLRHASSQLRKLLVSPEVQQTMSTTSWCTIACDNCIVAKWES
jgi:hypothetical protein